jgi:hypothetical protein
MIMVAWCGHAVAGNSSANRGRGAAGGAALPSTMRGSRLRPRMFAGIGAPTRSSTVGATSASITGSSITWGATPGTTKISGTRSCSSNRSWPWK